MINRASIRLICNITRSEHTLTDMSQYNNNCISYRIRCNHRVLCLAHRTI